MNNNDNQDIKKSLKATSLFGGVQVFSILISIVRNKIVAVLIGPTGVGVVELYTSTVNLIKSFSDFSLQVSAVRDVSIAYKSGDVSNFIRTASVVSRIVWFTGLLGLIICLLGSPFWSKLAFDDYSYTWGFAALSIVLLLNQLERGNTILLQSTEHYKYLAFSGVIGNLIGLLTTLPIYLFLGLEGIIPVLIITAATAYILSYYYASKLKITKEKLSKSFVLKKGKLMLQQGFLISVNYLLSALIFYILRIFITDRGSVVELGLFSAGFAVVNTYVGLVFQAMAQEYYPRISALSSQNDKLNSAVNNQIYLSLLILGPLIFIFLFFSDYLLSLLYSDKFVGATLFMALSMLGVVFQAPSWCMSYSILARADNSIFLIFETVAKLQKLATDVFFYLIWGLTGLGISFIVSYIYYMLQCAYVCNKRNNLVLTRKAISMQILYFVFGCLILFTTSNITELCRIIIGVIIIFISSGYSYYKLDSIIGLTSFVKNKFFVHDK